ncbi:hypothetical protein A6R68_18060 [Neotoma lepida]|uniref:Sperm equatorial segment protein 1 n=1 Tax=Neotoma lepida TaxID=56216 RepID=A0A1A6HM45_NEOLE|nr:hypothetical protein A6R68_18060 [Neotoma lepida]
MHTSEEVTFENDVLISPVDEEKTTFHTSGFTLGMEREKITESTPFWSIRPMNVSLVSHAEEPHIEKEEPEPELEIKETSSSVLLPPEHHELEPEEELEPEHKPEDEDIHHHPPPHHPHHHLHMVTSHPLVPSTHVIKTMTTGSLDVSTDSEDVPQLSGPHETENFEDISEHHSESSIHEDILRKISNINSDIHQGPLSDGHNPKYREYIEASREHLKRSLALAAAAEHRLQEMYRSHIFSEGHTSDSVEDMEIVINMLYNSRFRLQEYLNIKHVPSELRKKVTAVTDVLKKTILCRSAKDCQSSSQLNYTNTSTSRFKHVKDVLRKLHDNYSYSLLKQPSDS